MINFCIIFLLIYSFNCCIFHRHKCIRCSKSLCLFSIYFPTFKDISVICFCCNSYFTFVIHLADCDCSVLTLYCCNFILCKAWFNIHIRCDRFCEIYSRICSNKVEPRKRMTRFRRLFYCQCFAGFYFMSCPVDRYRPLFRLRIRRFTVFREMSDQRCIHFYSKCIFRIIRYLFSCKNIIPSCKLILFIRSRRYSNVLVLHYFSVFCAACNFSALLSRSINCHFFYLFIVNIKFRYSYPTVIRCFCNEFHKLNFLLVKVECLLRCISGKFCIFGNFYPFVTFICLHI